MFFQWKIPSGLPTDGGMASFNMWFKRCRLFEGCQERRIGLAAQTCLDISRISGRMSRANRLPPTLRATYGRVIWPGKAPTGKPESFPYSYPVRPLNLRKSIRFPHYLQLHNIWLTFNSLYTGSHEDENGLLPVFDVFHPFSSILLLYLYFDSSIFRLPVQKSLQREIKKQSYRHIFFLIYCRASEIVLFN